jgi:hypothetical protein
MTVGALIKLLEKEDPKRLVVMSIDPEGNGFRELSGVERMSYKDGETGLEKLTPGLRERGFTEADVLRGRKAIVLWPE